MAKNKKDKVIEEVAEEVEEQSKEEVVEEEAEESKPVADATDEAVEEEAEVSTDGVEVDHAKQVSDDPVDLAKTMEKLEKLEKVYEEKVEKLDSLTKLDTAIAKVTSILEKHEERLAKVEGTPAATKTQGSMLVEKTVGGAISTEISPEVEKMQTEFDELMKVRDTDLNKFERENLGQRAFDLRSKIRAAQA